MKTIEEHRLFLENFYEEIKHLSREERISKLVEMYPGSDKHFELFRSSSAFCTAPWFGLNVHPAGKIFPCCAYDQNKSIGHLENMTMQQARNAAGMSALKTAMLSNQKSPGCQSCYNSDLAGGENLKTHLKNIHEKYIPLIGLSKELPLLYLDVQFSNLCNLRCRICGPTFSSSWISDHEKMHGTKGDHKIHSIKKSYADQWSSVLDVIESIDEVYFWGGEPLMMPEHYEFLQRLIERGRTDVKLRYSTNFSELEYGKFKTLDLWKNFKNLSVGASLDGSHARAEYMRKGTDWQKVISNRQRLMQEVPHARFFIACATSAYNIFHIADFFKEWVDLGYVHPDDFCVNLLYVPEKLSVQALNAQQKKAATEKIENLIKQFIRPKLGLNSIAEKRFQAAINHMNVTDKSHLRPDFDKYNQALDRIREESFAEAFPELQ